MRLSAPGLCQMLTFFSGPLTAFVTHCTDTPYSPTMELQALRPSSCSYMQAILDDDDDVYYYISERLKLEGETENMSVCTKE